MPETKNDMVALAMTVQLYLDREPKRSLPTRTRPTPSSSAQPEQSDVLLASSLYEDSRRKEVFCSYCERKGHKEAKCRKKSRNIKQQEGARPNIARTPVPIVNESGLSHRQEKDKNPACRQ